MDQGPKTKPKTRPQRLHLGVQESGGAQPELRHFHIPVDRNNFYLPRN